MLVTDAGFSVLLMMVFASLQKLFVHQIDRAEPRLSHPIAKFATICLLGKPISWYHGRTTQVKSAQINLGFRFVR